MSITTKIIVGLSFFIMFLLGWGSWDIRQNNIKTIVSGEAHAGIFDDILDAAKGHTNDIIERITVDDEFVTGDVVKSGEFTLTKDSIHWAKGGVQVIDMNGKTYIQLDETFEAGLAPDLYVFTSDKTIDSQQALNRDVKSNLQKLNKGSGASIYEVTGDIKSIVIWCQAFNQWMGTAIVK